MSVVELSSRIALKNILFLTDFSEPSEAALPFAVAIARGYRAKVYTLNAFIPAPYVYAPELSAAAIEVGEENAKVEMRRVEAAFTGLPHESIIERGIGVWPAVQQAMREHAIDLVVLGTHGRTGAAKLLLGSVAEEIFRRSPVPVLTIGPGVRSGGAHNGGRFRRVLLATDLSVDSAAAAPYAVSLAQENHARLVLLHVMRHPETRNHEEEDRFELSVAEAIHQMYESVPKDVELYYPPEVIVEYGDAAERIVAAAQERRADLIVLGVRDAAGHIGAATHLERATAHKVVSHAQCPVLTVRKGNAQS